MWFLTQFIKKKNQDFILSNGISYLVSEMLEFAFSYFKLDYLKFIHTKRKYLKKNEIKIKASNYSYCLKKIISKQNIKFMEKKLLD